MPFPQNKYDDYSSRNKIHGSVMDTTPYRDALIDILKGITEAYYLMVNPQYSKLPPNDEDFITAKLYEDFLDDDKFRHQFNLTDYTFELEPAAIKNYKQVGYKDIQVRVNNRIPYFESTKSAYVIECKRLDGLAKNGLNKKYIKNGIKRFVDELYTEQNLHKKSAMLGYIVAPMDIDQNIAYINDLIDTMPNLNTIQKLILYDFETTFKHSYHSKHMSIYGRNIDIYHLMLDLSSKI